VKQWKAAGAWYQWIVINFDATWLQPTSPPTKLPDGTWGSFFKIVNGQYVPTWPSNVVPIPGAS
jgi:hypothetical protein